MRLISRQKEDEYRNFFLFISGNKYYRIYIQKYVIATDIKYLSLPITYNFSSLIRSNLSEAAKPFGLQPGSPSGTLSFFF